jgi:hypothetical protein
MSDKQGSEMDCSNNNQEPSSPTSPQTLPSEFKQIVIDFTKDLITTFPECVKHLTTGGVIQLIETETMDKNNLENAECIETAWIALYNYCIQHYPPRFFDIIYQRDEMFTDPEIDTCFLPSLDFSLLWTTEDVTDSIKSTIWKYMQLVLLTTVENMSSQDSPLFGDTLKLFEAIDEGELKNKLQDIVEQMGDMFNVEMGEGDDHTDISGNTCNETDGGENEDSREGGEDGENDFGFNIGNLPDPQELHDHISTMLDGNLGRLAKEIATETAEEWQLDMEDEKTVGDVFQKMFKNPAKLMGLVKSVGTKLDEKLKSGDINQSELMEEAANMMKNMPGMKNMEGIFKKMGLDLGGKTNFNAMGNRMKQGLRQAKMRERMNRKLAERMKKKEAAATTVNIPNTDHPYVEDYSSSSTQSLPNISLEDNVFRVGGEVVERSAVRNTNDWIPEEVHKSKAKSNPTQKGKKKNRNKNKNKKKKNKAK